MQPYRNIVLVALRTLALIWLAYHIAAFLPMLFTLGSTANFSGILLYFVFSLVIPLVGYFLAPLLAHLATKDLE